LHILLEMDTKNYIPEDFKKLLIELESKKDNLNEWKNMFDNYNIYNIVYPLYMNIKKYLENNLDKINSSAYIILGLCYEYDNRNISVNVRDYTPTNCWKRALELKNYNAYRYLAYNRLNFNTNDKQVHYYKLAADKGCIYSQNKLGVLYIKTYNDWDNGLKYLNLANNSIAYKSLGDLYYNSKNDVDSAIIYYKKGSDLKCSKSMYYLAKMYQEKKMMKIV
jgi:TPR repeat protein